MSKLPFSSGGNPTVAVVLNVYKRGENFQNQLRAINNQTTKVDEVLVWENGNDRADLSNMEDIQLARSNSNLGVWSRFAFALNASTDFIWLIDDDTIPGARWLENALETFRSHPGVIGSRGLRFRSRDAYLLYDEFGPNFPNDQVMEVDIVGHNWIVPRKWLGFFWAEYEGKFDSHLAGEDIHISFAVQKHLGLGTFVPPHPEDSQEFWGEVRSESEIDGTDSAAISRSPKSLRRFESAYSHYLGLGFTIVNERTSETGVVASKLVYKAAGRFPRMALAFARTFRIRK
jgi:glycosyltransferase involved in cell wall biosynthesis